MRITNQRDAQHRGGMAFNIQGMAGNTTSVEGGGIIHIAGPPNSDTGFYALITDYHVVEVKNPDYDAESPTSGPEWIEELFYIWHEVNLVSINKREDEDGPIFYNSVSGTRLRAEKPDGATEGEVDTHEYINNVLLDCHGAIPINSLVWVEPTDDVYHWEAREENNVNEYFSPIFKTVWQGCVKFELLTDLENTFEATACIIDDDFNRIEQRQFKVYCPFRNKFGYGLIEQIGEEGDTDYEPEVRGTYGVAYVNYDNNFVIVDMEEDPDTLYGWVAAEFDEDDDYLYIYLGGDGTAPPIRWVDNPAGDQETILGRFVIDEVVLNEGESDEETINNVIKVRNIFRYEANKWSIAMIKRCYDTRDLADDCGFVLQQIMCEGQEQAPS